MPPTVITSNEKLEDLAATPGWRRIIDRIVEMCGVVVDVKATGCTKQSRLEKVRGSL